MITETGEDLDPLVDRSKILAFGYKVKEALRRIWDASTNDVFDVGYVSNCIAVSSLSIVFAEVHMTRWLTPTAYLKRLGPFRLSRIPSHRF